MAGTSSVAPQPGQVGFPLIQRGALFVEILVGVVGRDDAGLGVVQAPFGDIGAYSQPRQSGPDCSPKIVQREGGYLALGEGLKVSGDTSRQQSGIHRTITAFSREHPGTSVGQGFKILNCPPP